MQRQAFGLSHVEGECKIKTLREGGPDDQNDASTSQEIARIASKDQKQEETNEDSPLETSKGAYLCRHPDLKLLASKTVKEYISNVLNNPCFGTLLWHPWQTNSGLLGHWKNRN